MTPTPTPTPRSDKALEFHLQDIERATTAPEVIAAVGAVLRHIAVRANGYRPGGKKLTGLLAEARRCAARHEEWETVRSLQDAVHYTEGRLLRPDYEEKYRLSYFPKEPRDELGLQYIARTLTRTGELWCSEGRKILGERPGITPEELLTEIAKLSADAELTRAPEEDPARYHIPRGAAELAKWGERVLSNRVEIVDPRGAAHRIVSSPEALAVLAADEDGRTLLRAAELQRRAEGLAALRRTAEDPTATEHALQRALSGQHWIFGGRFVAESEHRRLVPGDELDIPLLRADGALHVVELKQAAGVSRLVKRQRGAWVPTHQVHDAVGQAINYLVGLDENRERIREEFGIDTRRASAVVLIGHPLGQPEVPEEVINEALRTHTAHLSRVEVLTYKELIDSAERALGEGAPLP
ncbi:Shedu anti-phage system protein SduA domain-containing protein [Streptomyces sp. NPDC054796]